MRLAGINTIADANWFLQTRFLPAWEERFTVAPRRGAMRTGRWAGNIAWNRS